MIVQFSIDNISVSSTWSDPEAIHVATGGLEELPSQLLSTKTVLGFLDFTTTVSDAVIKFTAPGGLARNPVLVLEFISRSWKHTCFQSTIRRT